MARKRASMREGPLAELFRGEADGTFAVQHVEASIKLHLLSIGERQVIQFAAQAVPHLLEEIESFVSSQLLQVECRFCHSESISRPESTTNATRWYPLKRAYGCTAASA